MGYEVLEGDGFGRTHLAESFDRTRPVQDLLDLSTGDTGRAVSLATV